MSRPKCAKTSANLAAQNNRLNNGYQVAIDGADADSVDMAALSEKLESISRVVRQTQQQQQLQLAADANAAALEPNSAAAVAAEVLQTAASDANAQASLHVSADKLPAAQTAALDELSLDDVADDDNRNKRYDLFCLDYLD